jgi:lysophospholipase L1-like esterase
MKPLNALRTLLQRMSGAQTIVGGGVSPQDMELEAAVKLSPIGDAVRLFLIGDSHCLPARDLLAADAFTGRDYIVVSKYIPGFSASSIIRNGKLSPALTSALESENLVRDGQFVFASLSDQELAISFAAGTQGISPVLTLSVGDIDLRSGFLPKLTDVYDIVLPYESPYAVRKGAKIMPYGVAREMARDALAPIAQGLIELRNMGLQRVLVSELPPPTLNQERFDAIHGFPCPVDTRYKATIVFNNALREVCAEAGATVVSFWPEVVGEDGYLRNEFELDGVHLNRAGNLRSLSRILSAAVNDGLRYCLNARRYELAYKLRDASPPEELPSACAQAAAREFHELGICRTAISPEVASRIAESLIYEFDVGNRHARLDWAGNTVTPFSPFVRGAAPDQETLDLLFQAVYAPEIDSIMRLCMGGEVWYANCRPFMSLAHDSEGAGPQSFHRDGCPPHVLRAIIYLVDVDVDNGAFEYVGADGTNQLVVGPRGTTFIFDANRLLHRASPPRARNRQSVDFVILPRMKSQPRRVLWAGNNNWPGDPFHFSINGMRTSPTSGETILRVNPLTG